MAKKHEIRNSTAEFLIFQAERKEQGFGGVVCPLYIKSDKQPYKI